MAILFELLARVIGVTIDAVTLLMLIRAVMSWFVSNGNKFYAFVLYATEIFVTPVRAILSKMNVLQRSPIDWSFMITYFLLIAVRSFLPAL